MSQSPQQANPPIALVPIREDELDAAFALYKTSLYPYIAQVFGWHEAFQRQRFRESYDPADLYWAEHAGERVALVCFKDLPHELHLHLLLFYQAFQGRGLGSRLMAQLHARAAANGQSVTLSSFSCNQAAVSFYKRLGYEVLAEDEQFVDLRLTPPPAR